MFCLKGLLLNKCHFLWYFYQLLNAVTFTHFKCDWSGQTPFGTTASESLCSKVGKYDRKLISTGWENINLSFKTFAAAESSHHRVSNVVFKLDCFFSFQSPAEINGTPVPSMQLNCEPNFFIINALILGSHFRCRKLFVNFLEKYSWKWQAVNAIELQIYFQQPWIMKWI